MRLIVGATLVSIVTAYGWINHHSTSFVMHNSFNDQWSSYGI